jgi:MFS family permease
VSDRSAESKLPGAYWRLWTASTVSNLGDGIFLVALPLLAARITRDRLSISMIGVFAGLPWLILSLPIGAIIDRSDRRVLMIRSDLVRAALVGGLAVAAWLDHVQMWMLWVLALGLGVAEVFFDNASQAIIPAIVPKAQLERANGRKYAAEVTANIFVGTPIGAVLFAWAVWLPFGIDAASFVLAVGLVATLRGSFRPVAPTGQRRSLYADVRTGLRWLWGQPMLRGLAFALGLSNFGFQMSQALFVLYAQDLLHVDETYFGVLLGVMGLGSIVGGLLGDRIVRRLGQLFALYASICIWIVSLLAVGTLPITWFVTLIAAIEAFAGTIWNVVTVSLRQQIVPDRLFGRVNSVYRWFGWGTIPLGALVGGLIADAFGLRAPYFAGAAVIMIALVVLLFTVTPAALASATADARETSADETPVSIERDLLVDGA